MILLKKQEISKFIHILFNENEKENKILNLIFDSLKDYTLNNNTKVYFLGHSIYGCLSFYLFLIPKFSTWLCEKNIKNTNINIGISPFMDENTTNSLLENNYNIYHLLNMKDINIFQKNEKQIHNGIPLILGNPEKIDIFYNSFFNTYCKNNDLLKK